MNATSRGRYVRLCGKTVLPDRIDPKRDTGVLVLADIYRGRNMAGVKRGDIKELLVLETLPKPINFTGSGDPISYNGTFTLERVVGTVPVEPDGSAHFEVPALRSFFFVALDANGLSVKRMQSFLSVQPGETLGCVGCHESRTETPSNRSDLLALQRAPSPIQPIPDVPEVFDYPRDIQPILDRHCRSCHDYDKREGGVLLTGDRGPFFSHSFWMLTVRGQFSDGRNRPRSNYPPRAIGSAASPLIAKIKANHHKVQLNEHEQAMIRLWIDTGAPFAGTYAALGTGMIGGYRQDILDRGDIEWPAVKAAKQALDDRCSACHTGPLRLPSSPSDDLGLPPWESTFSDPRIRFSRHILYNLTRPEKSLLLLAPLSKAAGGYGICGGKGPAAGPIFASAADPGYQTLLASIVEAQQALSRMTRFDMPEFRPGPEYLREMTRYGILPVGWQAGVALDVYKLDQTYWQSFWPKPRDP